MVRRLEDLCGVKIVTEFCMQPEVKATILAEALSYGYTLILGFIKSPRSDELDNIYQYFNEVLQAKFLDSLLAVPISLRNKMSKYLIPFIGIEIIKWSEYHNSVFDLDYSFCIDFMRSSFFNSNGTIIKELISMELLKNESLTAAVRFQIACHYSFTDYICVLWEKLTEEEKNLFRSDFSMRTNDNFRTFLTKESIQKFIDKEDNMITSEDYKNACFRSIFARNEISFKNTFVKLDSIHQNLALQHLGENFFFDRCYITVEFNKYKKSFSLVRLRNIIGYHDLVESCEGFRGILEFLLNELSNEQFQRIFYPQLYSRFLKALLIWPCQHLFIKVAKIFWENIYNYDFFILLHTIVILIADHNFNITFDYKTLLIKFWNMGSPDHKKYVLSIESGEAFVTPDSDLQLFDHTIFSKNYSLLTTLLFLDNFNSDDNFILQMILTDASADVKQKVVAKHGYEICQRALSSGKFDLADLFLDCCVSKEMVNEFKKNLFDKRDCILRQLKLNNKMDVAEKVTVWLSGS